MNLLKEVEATSTQSLWVDLTDQDGELISGGKRRHHRKSSLTVNIYISNSNVLIAGRDIKIGDNAF